MTTSGNPRDGRRDSISPSQFAWLTRELESWRSVGVIDDAQVTAILSRYQATNKLSLAKLLLTLGAVFVGFGAIWLVAANLDELAPLARFITVALIWLALLVGAEYLASRHAHSSASTTPSPVVGAVRVIAALLFGAVIFQAAQSLQVPAFEPRLVGLWGLGALLYAYAVGSLGALVIGVLTAASWFIAEVVVDQVSGLGAVLALLIAGVVAVSWAAIEERWRPGFSEPWREIGVGLLLVGLFVAAIPEIDRNQFEWTPTLVGGLVVTALLAAVAIAFGCGLARLEPAGAFVMAGLAVVLVWWEAGNNAEGVDAASWAHAALAVAAYVAASTGVAVLGIKRDSGRLTGLATVALVIFTTFQSFAVFARIIQGAWLFLVLGLILLATGYLADRARRRLAARLDDAEGVSA